MQFGLGIPTCREGLAYQSGFAAIAYDANQNTRVGQTAKT